MNMSKRFVIAVFLFISCVFLNIASVTTGIYGVRYFYAKSIFVGGMYPSKISLLVKFVAFFLMFVIFLKLLKIIKSDYTDEYIKKRSLKEIIRFCILDMIYLTVFFKHHNVFSFIVIFVMTIHLYITNFLIFKQQHNLKKHNKSIVCMFALLLSYGFYVSVVQFFAVIRDIPFLSINLILTIISIVIILVHSFLSLYLSHFTSKRTFFSANILIYVGVLVDLLVDCDYLIYLPAVIICVILGIIYQTVLFISSLKKGYL